ncbi:unnamed protein product [Ambrosiozyma monospora]|uniref:Unnamed protein product n=1 Tax=Ambrosiozyma monospora TaxID=43982 RepID=A0ACB5TFV0_AMBMO|nr:unnamed protein product [Ambrosiozyma monospora]
MSKDSKTTERPTRRRLRSSTPVMVEEQPVPDSTVVNAKSRSSSRSSSITPSSSSKSSKKPTTNTKSLLKTTAKSKTKSKATVSKPKSKSKSKPKSKSPPTLKISLRSLAQKKKLLINTVGTPNLRSNDDKAMLSQNESTLT